MGPAHPENVDTAAQEERARQELREHHAEVQKKKGKKPLKKYRSEAERIAMHQRYAQLGMAAVSLIMTFLILLRSFGIL